MRIGSSLRNIKYRLKLRTGYNVKGKNKTFFKKQLTNIIICIVIVLFIVMIKTINTKPTEKAIKIVRDTINYTVDIKKDSITALNFFKGIVNDTKNTVSVFDGENDLNKDGFIMPVSGKIYQPFGEVRKTNEIVVFHRGISILTLDTIVKSIGDGTVSEIKFDKLLGNTVTIINNDITTVYGHLDKILVYKGQTVKKGDEIGKLNTSDDKDKYLYLEVREKDIPIDPLEKIQESSSKAVLR